MDMICIKLTDVFSASMFIRYTKAYNVFTLHHRWDHMKFSGMIYSCQKFAVNFIGISKQIIMNSKWLINNTNRVINTRNRNKVIYILTSIDSKLIQDKHRYTLQIFHRN